MFGFALDVKTVVNSYRRRQIENTKKGKKKSNKQRMNMK